MKRKRNSQQRRRRLFLYAVIMLALAAFVFTPSPQWFGAGASNALGLNDSASTPEAADDSTSANDIVDSCGWQYPGAASNLLQRDTLDNFPGSDLAAERCITDPYPSFNGIAVDPVNNRVVMSDTNRKGLLIYDRAGGSKSAKETEPLRRITGPRAMIGFLAGVAVDPVSREVYSVNNDIEDNMVVFSYDATGNVKPSRLLAVPHQTWGVVLNRSRDELAITVQALNAVLIYRREAKGVEAPLRAIRGAQTGMADPHGVSWDTANNEIAVADHGNAHTASGTAFGSNETAAKVETPPAEAPSAGSFQLPSIKTYSGEGKGDVNPLRIIQGPKAQLDLPMGIDVDAVNNEIAVANNGGNSVSIFRRTDSGDVAPVRVIRGNLTGIKSPAGVAIDTKNNELWVANFGDHSAVVFARTANGNVAPKRIIRNAPAGTPTVGFVNPMAIAYDSKRQELLVPN